jgi:hypothetical protein
MKLLQLFVFLLNLSCFGQTPYIIQAQQPQRSCQNMLPVTWSCYYHPMCAFMVCDIFYSDNTTQKVCTKNPQNEPKQICQ